MPIFAPDFTLRSTLPRTNLPPVKQLSLALNAVLLVAVAALFYLHFSSQPGAAEVPTTETTETSEATEEAPETAATDTTETLMPAATDGVFKVAVIDMDTLQVHFKMITDLDKELKAKERSVIAKLEGAQRHLEEQAMELQEKAQSGLITPAEGEAQYQQLMMQGQKLREQQAREEEKLYAKQDEVTRELRNTLDNYLRRYNDEHNYDLIMRYALSSEIFQHDGAVNITSDVLNGMNSEYEAAQASNTEAK